MSSLFNWATVLNGFHCMCQSLFFKAGIVCLLNEILCMCKLAKLHLILFFIDEYKREYEMMGEAES